MIKFKENFEEEKNDLENRIEQLNQYLTNATNDKSSTLTNYMITMIHLQLNGMASYLTVLNLRINNLRDAEKEPLANNSVLSVDGQPEKITLKEEETIKRELAEVLNKNNIDTYMNTPDHILAEFLNNCLHTFGKTNNALKHLNAD